METLQSEKLRLLQFKSAKSKQIEAMETKIRDVEILENIDLTKVIEELKSRETKLKVLSAENLTFNSRIDQVSSANNKRLEDLRKQLVKERGMKSHAYDQLENMRLEIKAIEGKDMSHSELWKDKCRELYEICKDLKKENTDLRERIVESVA
jgi:hypothetical protein